MQSTGIVRKLDSLGRITLPMELRKSFDIGEREPLEIFTEEDKIIIKKYNPSDILQDSVKTSLNTEVRRYPEILSASLLELPDLS